MKHNIVKHGSFTNLKSGSQPSMEPPMYRLGAGIYMGSKFYNMVACMLTDSSHLIKSHCSERLNARWVSFIRFLHGRAGIVVLSPRPPNIEQTH